MKPVQNDQDLLKNFRSINDNKRGHIICFWTIDSKEEGDLLWLSGY